MSSVTRHPTPAIAAVALEQIRAAALAARWVWVVAAAFLALVTLIMSDTTGRVSRPEFMPAMVSVPAAMLAVILPQALWRHEGPTQRGYLHSLPLSPVRHQLLKNAAGWAWAMVGTALLYLWALAVIVPVTDTRLVALAPWQWAAPFVAASMAYVFAAAIATALPQPGMFIVGLYFVGMFLVRTEIGRSVIALGRFSMTTTGSGSIPDASFQRWITPAPLGDWLVGAALWGGVGLGLLYLAARLRRDV